MTPLSRGPTLVDASTRLQPAERSHAAQCRPPRRQALRNLVEALRNLVASTALASVALHCGDKAPSPATTKAQATPTPAVSPAPAGVTTIGELDRREVHLDDVGTPSVPVPRNIAPKRARSLELILRSTPSGAIAAVDGVPVGQTPILWQGEFTAREREFTFTAAGFATARYRFVPTTDGIVHGRLNEAGSNTDKHRAREGSPSAFIPPDAPPPSPVAPPAAAPAPSGTTGSAQPALPSPPGSNDAPPPHGGPGTAPTPPGTAGNGSGPAATPQSALPSPTPVTPTPLPPPVPGAAAAPAPSAAAAPTPSAAAAPAPAP